MVSIDGNKITLTRGDTLKFKLNLTDDNGDEYTRESGDTVKFGVKADYGATTPFLIEKTINSNQALVVHITPNDTKNLEYGTYVWDCQITFADGSVNTFITKGKFKVTEEVV